MHGKPFRNSPVKLRVTLDVEIHPDSTAEAQEVIEAFLDRLATKMAHRLTGTPAQPQQWAGRGPQVGPRAVQKEDQSLLLTIRQVSKLLNLSERTISNYISAGWMPKPIRFGDSRVLRWSAAELHNWIGAGSPPADEWNTMKAGHVDSRPQE